MTHPIAQARNLVVINSWLYTAIPFLAAGAISFNGISLFISTDVCLGHPASSLALFGCFFMAGLTGVSTLWMVRKSYLLRTKMKGIPK